MLGETKVSAFADLDIWEKLVLVPIVIAIILMGLLPGLITRLRKNPPLINCCNHFENDPLNIRYVSDHYTFTGGHFVHVHWGL